ncbi:ABC transporter ATP-binding protein [Leadbettera azotonutricia]|uniref:Cobalt import ATP-binding protein CbiO 1 n=1 Tax=Leadbettera azotonutricia (strain ATCC BAA-888 / DSM 13862 / ZAS-9) TaxID=545695 RepID=F5YBQ6_LEAAZ|nr:ATP-binding cassette domain-containing protein [Leadbettera azotonutricia]AEF82729.1 cobalt import ATP-binding protein CbiO 1 [Leadbettera azotonutricia ZAS-9]
MIRLENLKVVFAQGTPDENTALKNINLKINSGEFITIIGSNGAGKTTLLNAVSGTLIPTDGKVLIRDVSPEGIEYAERDITREAEHKRAMYMGRIFQNPLLGTAGKMSLEDNMIICHKKGYKGLKISLNKNMRELFRERLRELDMGLENRLGDNVELFSGGQRQALTLLMTVMSKPSLLLLDEHTAALDPRNAEIVMNLTRRFASEYKLTVIMITHNMAQALEYGNRLLMMDSGEIILDLGEAEKSKLTTADIVQRFRDIKKQELSNDELLLSDA